MILFLLIATVTGPAEAMGPTVIPHVDDVLYVPRSLFGRTREQIERNLGPPLAVRAGRLPSTRDPATTRAVQVLSYPGLTLKVLESAELASVELTAPGYALPHAVGVGSARAHLEATLGEPVDAQDERYVYVEADSFLITVEFHFRGDRVQRIEWVYWIE
jgi:hypothetical protein